MEKIKITNVPAEETNVDWFQDGEAANALVLNRPTQQVSGIVNAMIDELDLYFLRNDEDDTISSYYSFTNDAGINFGGGVGAAGTAGDFRYNPTFQRFEGYTNGSWQSVGGASIQELIITSVDRPLDMLTEAGKGVLVSTSSAAGDVTVTITGAPKDGQQFSIGDDDGNAFVNNIILTNDNSDKILGLAAPFVIDVDNAVYTFTYNAASADWKLTSTARDYFNASDLYIVKTIYPTPGVDTFSIDYQQGYLEVLINGIELDPSQFTAVNGTSVILNDPITENDQVVTLKSINPLIKVSQGSSFVRQSWNGSLTVGDTSISVTGMLHDIAAGYRLQIGNVLQRPVLDYTISSGTNEVLLTSPAPVNADWFLITESETAINNTSDKAVEVDNTGNSLTGTNVKENFDELDGKVETNSANHNQLKTDLKPVTASAWVNFNGTGTVAIRDSYNVSSITDNGTGDYTINFSLPFANGKYTVLGTLSANAVSAGSILSPLDSGMTPTSCRVIDARPNGPIDRPVVNVAIFGGQ